jgi:hypothetical protein
MIINGSRPQATVPNSTDCPPDNTCSASPMPAVGRYSTPSPWARLQRPRSASRPAMYSAAASRAARSWPRWSAAPHLFSTNGRPPPRIPPNFQSYRPACTPLTLTDANGCRDSATANIALLGMLQPMIGGETISCTGAADGWLSLTPATGAAPFSWLWDGWPGTDSIAQPLGPGNYSATVTDAFGCTASNTFPAMSDPAPITATVGTTDQTDLVMPNGAAVVTTTSGGTPSQPPAQPYQLTAGATMKWGSSSRARGGRVHRHGDGPKRLHSLGDGGGGFDGGHRRSGGAGFVDLPQPHSGLGAGGAACPPGLGRRA